MKSRGLLWFGNLYLEADNPGHRWGIQDQMSWDEILEYHRTDGRPIRAAADDFDFRYLRRLHLRQNAPPDDLFYYRMAAVAGCLEVTDYHTGEVL